MMPVYLNCCFLLAYSSIFQISQQAQHLIQIYNWFMERTLASLKLLVTRHGQTESNSKGVICGQQAGALTPLGQYQAKQIGASLNKQPIQFDQIYVSNLGRTVETFQSIKSQAKYLQQIPTIFTPIIRQKNGGVLEGQPLASWKQMAEKEGKGIREYKCEKGESWEDVNSRCFVFLKLLVEEHIIKNKNNTKHQPYIFVVCHAGVLMEFHNMVAMIAQKKKPEFSNTAKNCSFHEFVIQYPVELQEYILQEVKIKCIRQNAVEHLSIPL